VKVDLGLQVAANAFIDALTPIVASIGDNRAAGADAVRQRVTTEAYDLARGFIDADRRATDEELWSLIVAFAPVHDRTLLDRTPDQLRAAGLTDGARSFLESPSPLFAELLAADVRDGSSWSTAYYEHAVSLGFMTASLDDHTDRNELLTIERFRGSLLEAIKKGHLGPLPTAAVTAAEVDAEAASRRADGAATVNAGPGAVATDAATADAPEEEPLPPPRPIDELLEELDDLIGLDAVKHEVKLVTNLLRVQQLRRERGLKTTDQSRHLIFTGNPGTGKTTVARLLAQIYRTLGVVERGQLIETDRSGLVAGFVGQTATKVVEVFDRADGGVLLIDEAYALVRGSDQDFGREAIDTIVKLVEDRRDRLVVIAAGYPAEMNDFIGANPGLKSRFPKTMAFPDYTTDELLRIFQSLCDGGHYLCDADAKRRVGLYLESQPRVKGFGNGRLVRNLFEDAVARQASRVVEIDDPTDIDLVMLLPSDIPDPPPLPTVAPAPGS
jgi:hypothetical protein